MKIFYLVFSELNLKKIIQQKCKELTHQSINTENPLLEYHNYNELTDFLENIANQYPEITDLYSIGQSEQGRELWMMNITDNPGVNEVEPEFIIRLNWGVFSSGAIFENMLFVVKSTKGVKISRASLSIGIYFIKSFACINPSI